MMAAGIDVGKASLDVAIEERAGVTLVANSAAGIRKLARQLAGLDQVRIVVEATGSRLGSAPTRPMAALGREWTLALLVTFSGAGTSAFGQKQTLTGQPPVGCSDLPTPSI